MSDERDEKDLIERIVWMQALPEETAVRFLSAEGALSQGAQPNATLSERLKRLQQGRDENGRYNSKADDR